MTTNPEDDLELYKLYLATAEKVSDRRAQANVWMLSVNSAIVALYGYLIQDNSPVGESAALLWRLAIPAAGILNSLKFKVLHEMEARMPYAPLTREQAFYRQSRRRPLSGVESAVPWSFMALYGTLIVSTLIFASPC